MTVRDLKSLSGLLKNGLLGDLGHLGNLGNGDGLLDKGGNRLLGRVFTKNEYYHNALNVSAQISDAVG
jgi:hypothetical protein